MKCSKASKREKRCPALPSCAPQGPQLKKSGRFCVRSPSLVVPTHPTCCSQLDLSCPSTVQQWLSKNESWLIVSNCSWSQHTTVLYHHQMVMSWCLCNLNVPTMGSREAPSIDTAPLCSEHSALLTAELLASMATCRHMQIQRIRLYRRSSVPHVESQKRTRAKQTSQSRDRLKPWDTLMRKYQKQKTYITARRNHATEANSSPIQLRAWLKQNIGTCSMHRWVSNCMDSCFTVRTRKRIHTLNLESHYSLRHGHQACFAEHVRGHQLTAFRMQSLACSGSPCFQVRWAYVRTSSLPCFQRFLPMATPIPEGRRNQIESLNPQYLCA